MLIGKSAVYFSLKKEFSIHEWLTITIQSLKIPFCSARNCLHAPIHSITSIVRFSSVPTYQQRAWLYCFSAAANPHQTGRQSFETVCWNWLRSELPSSLLPGRPYMTRRLRDSARGAAEYNRFTAPIRLSNVCVGLWGQGNRPLDPPLPSPCAQPVSFDSGVTRARDERIWRLFDLDLVILEEGSTLRVMSEPYRTSRHVRSLAYFWSLPFVAFALWHLVTLWPCGRIGVGIHGICMPIRNPSLEIERLLRACEQ